MKKLLTVLLVLSCLPLSARPIMTEDAQIVKEGKNEVSIDYSLLTPKGRYDGSGNYQEFTGSESRQEQTLNFGFKYGASRGAEVGINASYVSSTYTKVNGDTASTAALGDIWLIGRNQTLDAALSAGKVALVAGIKFPNGKSLFSQGVSAVPSGTGTWDFMAGTETIEKRGGFILYGNFYYTYRLGINADYFAGNPISYYNAGAPQLKVEPGSIVKYNVAVEYPLSPLISFVMEYNGVAQYESKATFTTINIDALPSIGPSDSEYYFGRSIIGRLAFGASLNPTDKISIKGGASIPVENNTSYGGILMFGSLSIGL